MPNCQIVRRTNEHEVLKFKLESLRNVKNKTTHYKISLHVIMTPVKATKYASLHNINMRKYRINNYNTSVIIVNLNNP